MLYGQLGADVLRGADGLDVIDGGAGADVMTGGKDGDYFLFRIADGKSRDTVRDFTLETDQLVLEGGLTVIGASVKHMDFDGVKDTVLTLSNGGSIVLLGVNGSQDWSAAGPNVTTLTEFNDLNLLA